MAALLSAYAGPVGIYANGSGTPDPEIGWCNDKGIDDQYIEAARKWIDMGVSIVGGCCGTTPETIKGVVELIKGE